MIFRSALILILSFVCASAATAYAATPKIPPRVLCRAADGTLIARGKCKKTETRAVLTSLFQTVTTGATGPVGANGTQGASGATGPKGATGSPGQKGSLGLENCRVVSDTGTNLFDTADGTLDAFATCTQSTEYLLTYGFNTNAAFNLGGTSRNASLKAIPRAQIIALTGEGVPYGVEVTADRIVTTSAFVLQVDAICCPKN